MASTAPRGLLGLQRGIELFVGAVKRLSLVARVANRLSRSQRQEMMQSLRRCHFCGWGRTRWQVGWLRQETGLDYSVPNKGLKVYESKAVRGIQ